MSLDPINISILAKCMRERERERQRERERERERKILVLKRVSNRPRYILAFNVL